jgi:hypothetical protein
MTTFGCGVEAVVFTDCAFFILGVVFMIRPPPESNIFVQLYSKFDAFLKKNPNFS